MFIDFTGENSICQILLFFLGHCRCTQEFGKVRICCQNFTQQLCLRAGKVCAVELDKRLEPILEKTVGEFSNLEILWEDVLKLDDAMAQVDDFVASKVK